MQKMQLVQKKINFIKALINDRACKTINLIREENSSKGLTGNKVRFDFSGMVHWFSIAYIHLPVLHLFLNV